MRRANNTMVFGSQQGAPTSVPPTSVVVPAPERPSPESQWFATPVHATTETGTVITSPPMRRLADDLEPARHSFLPPKRDRVLGFAAIALTMIAAAGAGTYFFLGRETARKDPTPMPVSTTSVTRADVPAPEPVASEVTAPALPKIEGKQLPPVRRAQPVVQAPAPAPPPAKKVDMAEAFDDATLERAGFYRPTPAASAAPSAATTNEVPPLEPTTATSAPTPAPAPTDVLPEVEIKR